LWEAGQQRTNNPDDGLVPQEGQQAKFLACTTDIAIYGGAAGGGKGLDVHTPIPTPNGFTAIGKLMAGDTVFDKDGAQCRVLSVSEVHHRPCFDVKFSDGSSLRADDEHLWWTFDAKERLDLVRRDPQWQARRRSRRASRAVPNPQKGSLQQQTLAALNRSRAYVHKPPPTGTVRSTEELYATQKANGGRPNHSIEAAGAIVTATRGDLFGELPIEPYLLGLWLGDGYTSSGNICMLDADWREIERHIARPVGTRFEQPTSTGKPFSVYRFVGLQTLLADCGILGHKRIPIAYLRASIDDRIAVLQGLLDTDGHCNSSGQIEIGLSNPDLINDVHELVSSLGIISTINVKRLSEKNPKWADNYRILFMCPFPAFRLPRKLGRQKTENLRDTTRRRYIVSIEPVESAPTVCIAVSSPSKTYLAGRSFIPTHNSWALLMEPLKHLDNPHFGAVIFRRTSVQIRNEGGLWDESKKIYPLRNGSPREHDLWWGFPSGASITFAHLEHDKTVLDWHGSQVPLLLFDELTHLTSYQFWYMLSRNRSMSGVKPYVRATCNPDADSWVADLIGWWIDQDTGYPIPERDGLVRWFVRVGNELKWADNREDLAEYTLPSGEPIPPKSLTFIAARLSDNPALMKANPEYEANLLALNSVERERLLMGNWKIRWKGRQFFDMDALLMNKKPVKPPVRCDVVFGVIDSASKTGKAHDGTGVGFGARTLAGAYPHPLAILDWDYRQIEGAMLEHWAPALFARGEELARQCGARRGFRGFFIEDKDSGVILLQQLTNKRLAAWPIPPAITKAGKDGRALSVSEYVNSGKGKITEDAYHKTVTFKDSTKNHLLDQVENFSIADPDAGKRADDMLDVFCYLYALAFGNPEGF
jgi:hypothetical protein